MVRTIFRQELEHIGEQLVAMAELVADAIENATTALKTANLALAESVVDADRRIDDMERSLDDQCIQLIALQAPVATDLRVVVSTMRLSLSLERMGDLARHIALVARGRYPESALSGEIRPVIEKMADAATSAGRQVVELLGDHDLDLAQRIMEQDDTLDDLHRGTFSVMLNEERHISRQELIDAVLLGRYLERFGDHAVSIADRVMFLVTGELDRAAVDRPDTPSF